MGVRRGPVPLGQVLPDLVNPMLHAARIFDARCAANRARAEVMTAMRLLDQAGEPVHKLRLVATLLDEARDEIPKDRPQ